MKKILLIFVTGLLLFCVAGIANAIPINHALSGIATQSSTGTWGEAASADKAIDGNTDGNYWAFSVSHTNNDYQAWWQVDLGDLFDIDQIVLWNRTDCCGNRLTDFNVSIIDDSSTQIWSQTYGTFSPSMQIDLPDNTWGQIVKVQLNGTNYLQLAEVQVFGENPVPEPATMMLFGLGLLGLAGVSRKKQK